MSWSFPATGGLRQYKSTETTTIELQGSPAGATAVRDSFSVLTSFSVQHHPVDHRISGTVTSIEVRGSNADSTQTLPVAFAGTFQNGGLKLDSIKGQAIGGFIDCQNPALNRISMVQRNLIRTARVLSRGQTWTDSATITVCSGSIPVDLTTIRTYRVLGEIDGLLALDRSDRIVASGQGAQGQHRITLEARGTGLARLSLDPLTGELSAATGEYRTEVTVGSSGRLQRFLQVVRERTELVRK